MRPTQQDPGGVDTHPVGRVVPIGEPRMRTDPELMTAVQRALRHLVAMRHEQGEPLPAVPVAVVEPTALHLLLAAPLRPPAPPWQADGVRWSVPLAHVPAVQAVDAYPGFVEVAAGGGRHVCVDLACAPGLVEIVGRLRHARGLVEEIVTDLMRAPWSRATRVDVLDGTDRLDDVLSPAPEVPASFGGGVLTGRTGSPPRAEHHVVVVARPLTDDEREMSLARRRDAPTVLAVGVSPHGTGWVWRVDAVGVSL